ncbi:MFS transporter [Lentilactobacillus hilgardii]|uniref:Transporter, major facilitator family protein n=1 Tax=Lentilactobacillus hilgardii (strain ATCC 8290 / DSM 20176 / CCUG 30140 / JCM 1155 / KCTC 3500 / NBRC 15886 / NCIMB 8040 / NRRL B-1843 / 9) TaxID=1423757 RepID=C0XJH0_LENH9|nr:MFS transporter [Lentilactobacillus hilgardii]EEI24486.1 transporter, major facilitator family protein [Lentilactobacillus hilgardii DSM 20176 = ATCC 8290]KRK53787.1 MFS family major facilitator transporter, multidrug cation symporter [Lentilactobacillus hilgardii DSM 20176 = ATCC 8290]MCP9332768.1 MFS transporter [Lentilactobacillus hilgardii]MCP9349023.1 MFS transporter [Lentilactobacillus hilgardii]MCP9351885.1 MFS transporter [Lentilactobacillus hilgardii]
MELTEKSRKWFVATLLLGTFTMSISQSSLSTAYPTFMRYFNLPASTVAWLTTGFMLIMSVVMPLSPWLMDNFKFKPLYLTLLVNFVVGTLIVIFAPNFPIMMVGRLMEGFSVGVLFPSYQSIILEITPQNKRGSVMGTVGLVMGSALAVGPIISGVILQVMNWQAIFAFFLVVLSAVFILALKTVVSPLKLKSTNFDFVSVFMSLGIIGLLYFINEISHMTSGSYLNWIILGVSMILLYLFVRRQLKMPEPLLRLDILKIGNFDLGVALTSLSYMSLITVTIIMPLYYQQVLRMTPFWSGMALVPAAALLSWLNRRSGQLADRIGFKPVITIGFGLFIVGWGMLLLLSGLKSVWVAIICSMIIEAGNAFAMMPATTLGANSLTNELIPHGSSIIATFRQILGSTAIVLATVILGNGNFNAVFATFLVMEIAAMGLALMIKDTTAERVAEAR